MGLLVITGLIIVLLGGDRACAGWCSTPVPMQLKLPSAGIGLFILFIGLVDAGFIGSTASRQPPVGLGAAASFRSTRFDVIFVFTLLVTGRPRGAARARGILIGLVAGHRVAVVIEAIWHLGSAVKATPAAGPFGADLVGFALRASRPLRSRRLQPWQLRSNRCSPP